LSFVLIAVALSLNSLLIKFLLALIVSRAPASRPGKEGRVEGSQLRLYKAKEGRNEGMREAS